MADDRLWCVPFLQEMVHVRSYFMTGHLGKRDAEPLRKLIDPVQVVLHGMR